MDPYRDIAAFYDWEHDEYRDDTDFYLNIVREGPVLEVGVGTGRVMLPLVEAGLEVWGVDSSADMLERAAERLAAFEKAHLVHCPIQALKLPVEFATALMTLNFLWHLPELDSRLEALEVVRRHLRSHGMLVVDLSNPLSLADRGAEGELRLRSSSARGDRRLTVSSAAWDDESAQTLRLCLFYDETEAQVSVQRSMAEFELRYLFRSELELLLRLCGFDLRQIYGSYDLDPYSSHSPGLIAIATVA